MFSRRPAAGHTRKVRNSKPLSILALGGIVLATGLLRPSHAEHDMGRTTAAAERLAKVEDPQNSHTGVYVWTFPGAPIQVRLDLAVVARLTGGLEIGLASSGLLLGKASGNATEITDFQLLPDSADPGYEPAIDQAVHALGPTRVVGFYRTHEDELLRLNPEDYSLADEWFPEPYCVFLLIHQAESEPANATFFFRDERGMNGDFPFLEFPFDASRLKAGRHGIAEAPKEEPLEIPAAPILPAVPFRVEPELDAAAPPPPRRRVRVLKALGMAAGAACLLGGAAYGGFRLLPGMVASRSARPPAAALPTAAPSLGLRAERQNGDLKLTWNRESPAIAGAASGVLSILDGDYRRDLSLTAAQVRGGSLLYSPSGDQIQMQLAVSGQTGDSAESVIVILPKTGAPPQVKPLARAAEQGAAPSPKEGPAGTAARAQALKPFIPPKTQVGPAAAAPIDAPPPAAMPAAPAGAPGSFLSGQLRVPPRPPAKAAEQPNADAAPRVLPPAPYRPPVLVRQVMPAVPQVIKSMIVSPRTAEVRVSLDATGKVVKAEGVRQPTMPRLLLDAAEMAARQCRFQPAFSGDKPIPSEMILRFQFKPAQ
jgi:hypothetical protein